MPRALSLGTLFVALDLKTAGWHKSAQKVSSSMATIGDRAARMGSQLTMKVTAPLALLGGTAMKFANDFNSAFELTNTMMKLGAEDAKAFQKAVMNMSNQYGKSASDIMSSGYKVSSVLHTNAADTATILEVTTQAALAGKLSVQDATNAIVNSMSIYGIAAKDAGRVSDTLAATVREGNASWEDAAVQIPRVAGVAKPLGISLEEVGGAFAYMSGQAGSAQMASTAVSNLFMAMMNPTDEMRAALSNVAKSLGMAGNASAKSIIQQKGLGAVMAGLSAQVGGSTDKLTEMIPGMRGIIGATALFENGAKNLIKALDGVKKSAGETARQVEAGNGPAQRMAKAWNTLRNSLISTYIAVEPVVLALVEGVGKLAMKFNDLEDRTKKLIGIGAMVAAALGPVLVVVGNLMTVLGPILRLLTRGLRLFTSFGKITGLITKLYGAFASLGSTILAAMGPVGWTIAALLAVGAAFLYINAEGDTFRDKMGSIWGSVHTFISRTIGFFKNFRENMAEIGGWLKANWLNLLKDLGHAFLTFFVNMALNSWAFVGKVFVFFGVLFSWLKDNWKAMAIKAIQAQIMMAVKFVELGIKMIRNWRVIMKEIVRIVWMMATKVGEIAIKIGIALINGIRSGLTGKGFEAAFKDIFADMGKAFTAEGTFGERLEKAGFWKGLRGPLEGFNSSVKDGLKLNFGEAGKLAQDVQNKAGNIWGDEAFYNFDELKTSTDAIREDSEKTAEAWKGASAAVAGSVDAQSLINRAIAEDSRQPGVTVAAGVPSAAQIGGIAASENKRANKTDSILTRIDANIARMVNGIVEESAVSA